MEQRKLTAEELQSAETYIPLAEKYAVIQVLVPGCMERTESGLWRENVIGKKLVCLYILAGFYLKLTDTAGLDRDKPEFQFTLEDYDRLSRIERDIWEVNSEIAQEIMDDFRDMRELLDGEITAQLAEKNDFFNRFQELMRLELTPEVVQKFQQVVERAKETAGGEKE